MKTPLNAACVSILAATIGEAATAKRPSMQYPRWLIDKYATIRFKSDWAHAASDAKTIEQTASPSSHGPTILISLGKAEATDARNRKRPSWRAHPLAPSTRRLVRFHRHRAARCEMETAAPSPRVREKFR